LRFGERLQAPALRSVVAETFRYRDRRLGQGCGVGVPPGQGGNARLVVEHDAPQP
jgi:hypothetical protein